MSFLFYLWPYPWPNWLLDYYLWHQYWLQSLVENFVSTTLLIARWQLRFSGPLKPLHSRSFVFALVLTPKRYLNALWQRDKAKRCNIVWMIDCHTLAGKAEMQLITLPMLNNVPFHLSLTISHASEPSSSIPEPQLQHNSNTKIKDSHYWCYY